MARGCARILVGKRDAQRDRLLPRGSGVGGGSVNSSRGSSVGSSGYGGRRAEAYRPGAAAEALAGGATSRYNDVSPPRRGYR